MRGDSNKERRARRASGGGRHAVTKRGGRRGRGRGRGRCDDLAISHKERRVSGGGRQAATATKRGGRWG